MSLEKELHVKRFSTEFQKVHINVLYTASRLSQKTAAVLKPYNISWQQFNILRILRGMHPEPANIKVLTERMIDQMSNASRLVDKLCQKGFVERKNCPEDRRRVLVTITSSGLEVLQSASRDMTSSFDEQLGNLSVKEAQQLNQLLDLLRVNV